MRYVVRSSIAVMMLAVSVGRASNAQRPDTVRVAPRAAAGPPADSLNPPISPRRALAYSMLVPGYSQTVLGRHKAAAAFVLVEAMSIAMIRESGAEVHEARRSVNDSVVVSYVDATGNASVVKTAPRFADIDVRRRMAHMEDWIALLVANHLFAGADAFVAAHLWDVPAQLGLRLVPHLGGSTRGAAMSASLRW